nr:MAG TPA: hypothetical protein [Bacteriophage sp.]
MYRCKSVQFLFPNGSPKPFCEIDFPRVGVAKHRLFFVKR